MSFGRSAASRPLLIIAVVAGLSCKPERLPLRVDLRPGGAYIAAPGGFIKAELRKEGGELLGTRRFPAPVTLAELPFRWEAGETYSLRITDGDGLHNEVLLPVPSDAPTLSVEVEAPIGQGMVLVKDGDTLPFPLLEGARAELSVAVSARDGGPIRISAGASAPIEGNIEPGQRLIAQSPVEGPTSVSVEAGEKTLSIIVRPIRLSAEAVAKTLSIEEVYFPAGPSGQPDIARPAGRITLPSPLWQAVLDRTPLGTRPRNTDAPWSHTAVRMKNRGPTAINLVVRARVLGTDATPDPVFRPRMRSADDGTGFVSVLLRVPAEGEATAALPLFVDEVALDASRVWSLEISVSALGTSAPLCQWSGPLYASRGDPRLTVGLSLALLASSGGAALLWLRSRHWLGQRSADLVTIALFAALLFVAGTVSQLIGTGIGAILGPFSSLLTGILDDAVSTVLLGTLITLLPRPGTLGLAAVLGWLLRGFALGGFSPFDILFLTSRVFYLELFAWVFGLSRGEGLNGAGVLRWLRLGLGLGLASAVGTLSGLVLQSVLYRLSYADWYVAMIVIFPGFLYVLAASGVALRFADSLRRVEG